MSVEANELAVAEENGTPRSFPTGRARAPRASFRILRNIFHSLTTPDAAPPGTLRFEFLRRKGSGLVYAPQKSTTLEGSGWSSLSATPVVTSINDQWERVVYTGAPDPVPATTCYGRSVVHTLTP